MVNQQVSDTSSGEAARFLGARTPRKEDPRLLSGQGSYVGDVVMPGMGHIAFVRSPYPHARIEGIDASAARDLVGVRGVLTGADLLADDVLHQPNWHNEILPVSEVTYVGEPIALVVADTRAIAEDAVELVEVEWEVLPAVADLEAAITDEIRVYSGSETNVIGVSGTTDFGEIDSVIASAPHVFTEKIEQHRYVHSPMETRGVIARWQSAARALTIWISTQGPHPSADHYARLMNLPRNAVRVIASDVGGSFGQKISVSREETAVGIAARILNRPVKWIEDRYENLMAAPHARREFANVTVATDDDGHLLAMKVLHFQDVGAYGGSGGIQNFERALPGPYRFGKVEASSTSVRTNTSSRSAYRGPWMLESVVRETMMDIVARRLDLDPLELRRRNILHRQDLPYTSGTGAEYDLITCDETLERAAALVGYEDFRAEQERARAEGRYLGVGFSVFVEPSAGGARQLSDGVGVRIDATGKVFVSLGNGTAGHSVETTMCQLVADELGVDIEDIAVVVGDTFATPAGGNANGSRNAVSGGNSAIKAATDLRDKVLQIAAGELEASIDDLEIAHGVVSVAGAPVMSRTFAQIAHIAQTSAGLPPGMQPGLEMVGRYTMDAPTTWSNAAHVATVEVDVETGKTTFLRYIVSEDCGVMINPNVVEGQIAGGVVQGIGGVLYEHFIYDDNGNPLTTTYLDYLIATSAEVPEIEYDHLETVAPTNPGGFKGLGEGGAIGAPAAVINAIADALSPFGVTAVTRQPLSPPAVLEIIDRAGAARTR